MSSLIALDPLLDGGLLWTPLFIVLLKVIIVFVVGLVATMLMVWFERKVIAGMQNRVGPNKAGPWGLLQTLADGTKLFFKEDLLPERSDRLVFRLAPYLALVPAFLAFAIIPLGGDFRDGKGGLVTLLRCTASCLPDGLVVRSTHCWGQYAHRHKWCRMKQHLVCLLALSFLYRALCPPLAL
jgi:NADH-quinone oxidoreductase subunit H